MWKGLTAMAHTLAYDTIALMEQYPSLDTKSINVKTLVLYGASSPPFMGDTATRLSQALPHATLKVLEGQSHDVKADAVASLLATFFSDN